MDVPCRFWSVAEIRAAPNMVERPSGIIALIGIELVLVARGSPRLPGCDPNRDPVQGMLLLGMGQVRQSHPRELRSLWVQHFAGSLPSPAGTPPRRSLASPLGVTGELD
jgi:hypothetical protein